MKKSTDESAQLPPEENVPTRHPELIVDVFFSEGGFSLLIIFPMTVFYFLSMALSGI